ncbi:MAG: hypothetical protein HYV63_11380 [Candidatus Schekmanbacteria bacterium]|nr:hypothetical protein [Candidatus Schekmanbacteria bacterium]
MIATGICRIGMAMATRSWPLALACALTLGVIGASVAGAGTPRPGAPAPSDLAVLPDLRGTEVTLGWDDFKRLATAASPAAAGQQQAPPPQEYAVTEASYEGTVSSDGVLRARARVTVDILSPSSWVRVPLLGRCTISAVRSQSDLVVVSGDGYELWARGAGKRAVELDFAVAGPARPGRNELSFTPVPAPVANARFLPGSGVERVEAANLVATQTAGSETRVSGGALTPGAPVALSYYLPLAQDHTDEGLQVIAQTPKVYVEEETLVTIGDGVMSLQTTFAFQVLMASVTTFSWAVPQGAEILDVQAPNLTSGFRVLDRESEGRELQVTADFAVKGPYAITVLYERAIGEQGDSITVPLLAALGVERATGAIGIEAAATAEVDIAASEKVIAIDAAEVPSTLWERATNPLLLGFRYHERPFRLDLRVRRHEDLPVMVASCDEALVTSVMSDDGATLTRAVFTMRNNRKQFLAVDLPVNAEIWSVFVQDKAARPGKGQPPKDSALARVLIPLPRSEAPNTEPGGGGSGSGESAAFPVEVVYFTRGAAPRGLWSLLELGAPALDVPISRLGLSVFLPRESTYRYAGGSLRPVPPSEPERPPLRPPAMASGEMAPAPPEYAQTAEAPQPSFAARQSAADQLFRTNLAKKAYDKGSAVTAATGGLPVRIAFPAEGENLRFQQILAIGAPATVQVLGLSGGVATVLGGIAVVVGMLAAAVLLLEMRRAVRQRAMPSWVRVLLVAALVVGGAGLGWAGGSAASVWFGVVGSTMALCTAWLIRAALHPAARKEPGETMAQPEPESRSDLGASTTRGRGDGDPPPL